MTSSFAFDQRKEKLADELEKLDLEDVDVEDVFQLNYLSTVGSYKSYTG